MEVVRSHVADEDSCFDKQLLEEIVANSGVRITPGNLFFLEI